MAKITGNPVSTDVDNIIGLTSGRLVLLLSMNSIKDLAPCIGASSESCNIPPQYCKWEHISNWSPLTSTGYKSHKSNKNNFKIMDIENL